MQLIQVNAIDTEPLQTALKRLTQMRGSSIVSPHSRTAACPASLSPNHQIFRIGPQRLRNQFFINIGAVRIGGINEVHPELRKPFERPYGFRAVGRRTPDSTAGEAHGAKPEAIDLSIGSDAESARLRCSNGRAHGCISR